MNKLYDQVDPSGNIIASAMLLVPGLTLPQGHRWVSHQPSLDTLKAEKRIEIERLRDRMSTKPVEASGYYWQADKRSQDLLSNAVLLSRISPENLPPVWRTLDNQDIPASLDLLVAISSEIAKQVQAAYARSWLLKEQVNQARTTSQLQQITWS